MRRWISASSSIIFCRSIPVSRCNCISMMACACFSLNSNRAISASRASRGWRDARTIRITSSRVSSAFWQPPNQGSRSPPPRLSRLAGRAHDPDYFVEVVERLLEPQQQVLALARLAQFVIGAAANHFLPVVDEVLDDVHEPQFPGLPVDNRKHDHAEAGLKLGVLVEVVEHHLGLFPALQLEDNAHAVAVALVANIADALDLLVVHQGRRLLDQFRFVDLVGNLRDDNLFLVLAEAFDGRARADLELPPASGEGVRSEE